MRSLSRAPGEAACAGLIDFTQVCNRMPPCGQKAAGAAMQAMRAPDGRAWSPPPPRLWIRNRPLTRAPVLLQARLPLRDPHDCTDGADEIALYEAVFDTLVRRDGTGFVPRLAARWTVAPDARTWEFYLRPGVVFHDGTACDAAAVCRSLIRMARADKGYTLGSPGVWHQYLGDAEITAPDAAQRL